MVGIMNVPLQMFQYIIMELNVTPHPRLARSGRAVGVQAFVRRLYLFYSSVVTFQSFIITPFTVSVYEFIGGVPWMLP